MSVGSPKAAYIRTLTGLLQLLSTLLRCHGCLFAFTPQACQPAWAQAV